MSSLMEIEAAVQSLSPQDQLELLEWLRARVPHAHVDPSKGTEALQAFRTLQREIALTPARASAWKAAVIEARP